MERGVIIRKPRMVMRTDPRDPAEDPRTHRWAIIQEGRMTTKRRRPTITETQRTPPKQSRTVVVEVRGEAAKVEAAKAEEAEVAEVDRPRVEAMERDLTGQAEAEVGNRAEVEQVNAGVAERETREVVNRVAEMRVII